MAKLIKLLTSRGYRVAAVKHAAHGYDMDIPGKDSWQHFRAGAETVVLVGPDSMTVHERKSEEPRLDDALDIINCHQDIDLVLVEGFKSEPGPKIQIVRGDDFIPEDLDPNSVAIVSDSPLPLELPCFYAQNLDPLADFIVANFMKKETPLAKSK